MTRPRCDQTAAWSALQKHFESTGRRLDLREAFRSDAGRFEALSQQAPHVFADLSKNLLDAQAEALLLELARECELERHRDAMFAGEPINNTEAASRQALAAARTQGRERATPMRPRCMPRWTRCWPMPSRCAATPRSPTS